MTSVAVTIPQLPLPPFAVQMSLGRQPQEGLPAQDAGRSAQKSGGESQGSRTQAGPVGEQKSVRIQPPGQTPPSGSGMQPGPTPLAQLG
jgi:hypothetical protein